MAGKTSYSPGGCFVVFGLVMIVIITVQVKRGLEEDRARATQQAKEARAESTRSVVESAVMAYGRSLVERSGTGNYVLKRPYPNYEDMAAAIGPADERKKGSYSTGERFYWDKGDKGRCTIWAEYDDDPISGKYDVLLRLGMGFKPDPDFNWDTCDVGRVPSDFSASGTITYRIGN